MKMRKNSGAISVDKLSLVVLILALLSIGAVSVFMVMDIKKHKLGRQEGKGKASLSLEKKAALSQFKPVEVSKIKKTRQLKDYALIMERNPFAPYTGASRGKAEGKGEVVSGKQKKSSILSETPKFLYRGSVTANSVLKCALEDVETKEIYFLKKGDNIGEYIVLDIQRDKVILSQKKAPQAKNGEEIIVPLFE